MGITTLDAPAPSTGEKLIAAAAAEFDDHGFLGTDTNKIARRAGFAPQTFYRWHKDKTAIFLAVMAAREPEELNLIGWLLVGLVIYFSYSIRHSKVQKLPTAQEGD